MSATGSEIKFAAKKADVWGTPVAVGANNGFLIRPSTFKKQQPFNVDDSLGLGWPSDGDLGEIKVDGDVVGYMRFDSLDLMIAMAMGGHSLVHTVPTAGGGAATGGTATTLTKTGAGWTIDALIGRYVTMTSGTNAGKTRKITDNTADTLTFATMTDTVDNLDEFTISGAATTHVYTLAENTDGQFITACAKMGTISVDELTTTKVAGFTLKGGTGKPIEAAFKIIAHDRKTNSATNTTTTILNVTFPETANRLLYSMIKFRMNAGSGAALQDTDRIYPVNFEFSFQRKMTGVYGVGGSYDNIDEPTNDGNPNIGLKFELGRYEAGGLALITAKEAGTAQKVDITFTGALLSGATYRSLFIEVPNAKFADIEAPMKEGILTVPADMFCLGRSAAPTGMTNLTAPFRLTLVNQFGGDVLQEAI